MILHGTGDNGKTTLVNAVLDALGDYAIQAARDLLLAKRDAHPTELTDLFGTRFVSCAETDDGRRLAEALVKQLTGRERIRARGMRQDFWQFDPTHTVFLATNHRPEVRGTDHAIWRRIKLVPFEVKIPEEEKDRRLQEKLRAERPGILAWIVRGCLEYQREGLGEPEEVKAATEGYRSEMDVLAAFIEDRCVVHPKARAGATPLYNAYKSWCEDAGEDRLTQTKFGRRLKERDFTSDKVGTVIWHGIGLRDDRPDPDPGRGPGGSPPNPPDPELPIDKGDSANRGGAPGGFGPENGINGENTFHVEPIPKKGPNPPNPPEDAALRASVAAILGDPPHRLADVVEKYRRDPDGSRNPTASRMAGELYGTAIRWREVLAVLEEIERGGPSEPLRY